MVGGLSEFSSFVFLIGNPKAEAISSPSLAGASTELGFGVFSLKLDEVEKTNVVSVAMAPAALGSGVLLLWTGAMGVVVTVAESW